VARVRAENRRHRTGGFPRRRHASPEVPDARDEAGGRQHEHGTRVAVTGVEKIHGLIDYSSGSRFATADRRMARSKL
jgi:hypothetical protein